MVKRSLNLPYHLGRALIYGLLGALSALLLKPVTHNVYWPWLAALLLIIAGTIFITTSISSLVGCNHRSRYGWVEHVAANKPHFLRGILTGFIPCGLLYAALLLASTTTNPFMAFTGMVLFVSGTLPAFWLASLGAEFLSNKGRFATQKIGKIIMGLNGCILLVLAAKIFV